MTEIPSVSLNNETLTIVGILERIRGLKQKKKAAQASADSQIRMLENSLDELLDEAFQK